jgi:micrococcal nuclease
MRKIIVTFLLLASLFVSPAYAQKTGQFPQGDFTQLREAGTLKVMQVIDPQTIALEDKQIIQLTGIDYPDLRVYDAGTLAIAAKDILADMLEDQQVTIYLTEKDDWGRSNRMGHTIAEVERKGDAAWIQGTLVSLGLARVRTTQRNPEMAAQLYRLEAQARAEKLGLWESDQYKILTPEEAEAHMHSFQIVEGRIESVSVKSNRLYLNFGKDWKKDFTISIAPKDKRLFSKEGMDPMGWNGKTIRVRGWVRSYNGPYMEIDHPEAVELIGEKPAP